MRFVAKTILSVAAISLSLTGIAQAQPLISAFIGTQTSTSKIAYFVLDFNDTGANPETYAFGWYYEGNKKASDFPIALASALTGANGFVQTGAENNFITRLGYNGRQKFNNFAGNNSGEPNGYWNLWLGFDGNTWTNSQFGASSITLSDTPTYSNGNLASASWTGWRWLGDYTTQTAQAPRTPVVVPEPATVALLSLGLLGGLLVRRNRKH